MEMASMLFAREIGEGVPVLFIHGWEMNGKAEELDYEPVFTKVSGFRRIYVDLPGMGATPAKNVKNLDDMYSRLVEFIDAQLGSSRFLLVGSSCGGYLANALAQKYGDQLDGLLLRVPVVEPESSLRDLDTFKPIVLDEKLMLSLPSEDKELLGDVLVQTPVYIESLKERYKASYLHAVQMADKNALDAIRADPQRYKLSVASESKKREFFAPTLIICGRQDDDVGYRDSLRLLELYPRSTFVILDRGRHDLPVDDNGVFETLVNDWLTRVNEWRHYTIKQPSS